MRLDWLYGMEKFGLAFDLLEEVDLTLLAGRANTVNNRLRMALLEVLPCGAKHFRRKRHFEAWMAIRSEVAAEGPLTDAVERMAPARCAQFARRLVDLTREIYADSKKPPGAR